MDAKYILNIKEFKRLNRMDSINMMDAMIAMIYRFIHSFKNYFIFLSMYLI